MKNAEWKRRGQPSAERMIMKYSNTKASLDYYLLRHINTDMKWHAWIAANPSNTWGAPIPERVNESTKRGLGISHRGAEGIYSQSPRMSKRVPNPKSHQQLEIFSRDVGMPFLHLRCILRENKGGIWPRASGQSLMTSTTYLGWLLTTRWRKLCSDLRTISPQSRSILYRNYLQGPCLAYWKLNGNSKILR